MVKNSSNLFLGAYDYASLVVTLVLYASISIYFALKKSRTPETAENYLFGGRQMSAFPISISLLAR